MKCRQLRKLSVQVPFQWRKCNKVPSFCPDSSDILSLPLVGDPNGKYKSNYNYLVILYHSFYLTYTRLQLTIICKIIPESIH